MAAVPVYIESAKHRIFACALDWPGWCRSARDEAGALEALAKYAPRYAVIAKEAGHALPANVSFKVVEHLPGTATTEFGAPDRSATADEKALTPKQAARLADLVAASWTVLDRVVRDAPAELRKGPRGGGRDRDKIVEHVLGAEANYA